MQIKKFYISKTLIFFGLTLLVSVAGAFGFADFQVNTEQAEIIGIVVSVVGIVLRFLTKQPIGL
uniref:Holin n=1 Tax=viral metagenome TaxID=1070528 RepID=A0A6M3ITZ7_9ZZZZ